MGHKVNPLSLRLLINKNWRSNWINTKKYAQFVEEDFLIRKMIRTRYPLGTIGLIRINRDRAETKIIIETAKPGIIIGRNGQGIEELKLMLLKKFQKKFALEAFEIQKPEIDAQIVAENIAFQIEKRVAYRKAVKQAIERALKAGALGFKSVVAGRLNGAEIARREKFAQGSVPSQTLRADIDFAKVVAFTKFGTIGIKVWIYKGEKFDFEGDL
jgi:small subunit ribosomal protein S3